jgi:hypothetical protein
MRYMKFLAPVNFQGFREIDNDVDGLILLEEPRQVTKVPLVRSVGDADQNRPIIV